VLKEIPMKIIHENIRDTIDRFNLQPVSDMQISKLSGGMLRRLGVAQAILSKPRILIVDEPTAGLDPHERVNFRQNLLLLKNTIPIIIISSHIVDDIESVCDKVVILDKGNLLIYDTPQNIVKKVDGKVWTRHYQDGSYGVDIEQMNNIVDFKKESGGVAVRMISEDTPDNSVQANPKLEDAYLYLVH
jgi:ABC-2 type transport system ATP-binding protein